MFTSFKTLAVSSLLATSAFAAPLDRRDDSVCSPGANVTSTINPDVGTRDAWSVILDQGFPVNVTLRTLGTMETDFSDVKFDIEKWNDADDQYRIKPASVNGTGKCLAASCDSIASADCHSPLAAWTIKCQQCRDNGGGNHCTFQSTARGACVNVVEFGENFNTTTCKDVTEPDGMYSAGNQFFSF
ncbi:hypothetical protein JCM10212_003890 [Sporobolomyces blumeae]